MESIILALLWVLTWILNAATFAATVMSFGFLLILGVTIGRFAVRKWTPGLVVT